MMAAPTPARPLAVEAVLAEGLSALTMARKLLARLGAVEPPLGLARSAPPLIILSGPAERLPWVEGARWFGRDPRAPHVLIPTTWTPKAPVDLWARALKGLREGPLLYDPKAERIFPLDRARPVEASRLQALLEKNGRKN